MILNYFKMTPKQADFSQIPLISFKRDKNVGDFLVSSALKYDTLSRTFN